MSEMLLKIVWRAALVCGAVFLAWHIISVNMSDHFVDLSTVGDETALDAALDWEPSHPRAQALLGARMFEAGNEAEAEKLLVSAIMANPADAGPLMLLELLVAVFTHVADEPHLRSKLVHDQVSQGDEFICLDVLLDFSDARLELFDLCGHALAAGNARVDGGELRQICG